MGVNLIVSVAENGVIGSAGKIPWDIQDDIRLFKEITLNSVVIMGRKTWESLPKKPLPNRVNVVVSKNVSKVEGDCIKSSSLKDAIKVGLTFSKDVFIIGGANLYQEAINKKLMNTMYISEIHDEYEGDVFFPQVDFGYWDVEEEEEYDEFTFKKYIRN